ncbi:MAG: N-acetyl sugar amidotransferase [Rhodospirillales bacterium]|jgi:N-acetyl sugar amidotransferase|nr:N-acetyl sugar amidotransferase [Rhodospirillales bacterium]
MNVLPRHQEIDYAKFSSTSGKREALYGLPKKVTYCKKCIISNQRPSSTIEFKNNKEEKKKTIHLDENGVCDACNFAEQKENIDWEARERELVELCNKHRRTDGRYDCVVSGSGGKDSFYIAHKLKYKYGMNPLTVTWAPHIYTGWGRENLESWIHAGFDNSLFTPNGRVHRLLTRLAVENLFHPFQPFILGQKNLAPKEALLRGIDLVFYGENEAEYGNARQDNESAKRDWSYFSLEDKSKVFLSGTSLADLKDHFGMKEVDFSPYLPVDPSLVEDSRLEVHYMGYYEKWHPQGAYYFAMEHSNFQASPERTPGTYSKYSGVDDMIDDYHFFTTWLKFGIGRATYDAAQEIRNGDIEREEGVALVQRYDGEYPKRFEKEVFKYLSLDEESFPVASTMFEQPTMDREYFDHLCDRFRSPHIWNWQDGQWSMQSVVSNP